MDTKLGTKRSSQTQVASKRNFLFYKQGLKSLSATSNPEKPPAELRAHILPHCWVSNQDQGGQDATLSHPCPMGSLTPKASIPVPVGVHPNAQRALGA